MSDEPVEAILVDCEEYAALVRLLGGVMATLPRMPEGVRAGLQLLVDECERTSPQS